MIIAIDGPAGTGKSTVAKKLAQKLGFSFFDTGAMYRAVTYWAIRNHVPINEEDIKKLLKNFHFTIQEKDEEKKYFVNNEDVTAEIRSVVVNQSVSKVACLQVVREQMVRIQREFGQQSNAVFEGRDIGTVVFPHAIKFFLTARPEVRAERRYLEFIQKNPGYECKKSDVLKELMKRDEMDSKRELAPLKKASDAFEIDTSELSIEEVVEKILSLIPRV